MPSKRPSTSLPSKSKKPSSSDPGPEDPPQNPNPNPKQPKSSTSSTPSKNSKPPKTTPEDPVATDAASPRKSQRKRKAREFPDEELPAGWGEASSHVKLRLWTEDHVLGLLQGVLDFRARTGAAPTASTIAPFFDSVKASLPLHVTQAQVYNKLRHLRPKYAQVATHGPCNTRFYKLAAEVWGAEGKKANSAVVEVKEEAEVKDEARDEENDTSEGDKGASSYPFIRRSLFEFWGELGLEPDLLDMRLKLVDPVKAKALEVKFRRQCEAKLKLLARWCDLNKELCLAMAAACSGMSF